MTRKTKKPMHRALMSYVQAPIIVWQGYGRDDVPWWIRHELPRARLAYLRNGGDLEHACDLDVVAYLMTASQAFPFNREWAHIYLHLAGRVMAARGVALPAELQPEVDKPLGLDEEAELDRLRRWIRRRQVKRKGDRMLDTCPNCGTELQSLYERWQAGEFPALQDAEARYGLYCPKCPRLWVLEELAQCQPAPQT